MKKYIFIIATCLFPFLCHSQELESEIPINSNLSVDPPTGSYIKDLEGVYTPYIGEWQGAWNNKTFHLTIIKAAHTLESYPDGSHFYRDILYGKFKVIDGTGTILTDNTQIFNYQNAKLRSIGAGTQYNKIYFTYRDADFCNLTATIVLNQNLTNPNELTYHFNFDNSFITEDCQYYLQSEIPVVLPTISLTLTRIN